MMDDREFLKKIRKIQEGTEKISLTNMPVGERDIVRLVEASQRSQYLIKEEIQTIEPDEQRTEENKFKDIVPAKLVKFQPIKVYEENVEWSGYLTIEKINWTFSLDDSVGCYIDTAELIQLRDETLEVLKKLRGYYDVWSEEWSSRLTGGSAESTGTEEEGTFGGEETGGEEGGEFGF